MAEELSKLSGIPILNEVRCSSLKTSQSKLSRQGRTDNVIGKFCPIDKDCFERKVSGKRVLLFDDVLTTGATLHEFGSLFRDAGAMKTDAMVFATGRNDSGLQDSF